MDAKQLGTFIAERRKELGFTQAHLAEKIHMTDKAVSRWERGVGLPDITSLEPLANALEVSLVQLLQTKSNFTETIKTNDAERLLVTTIQLSKRSNSLTKVFGGFFSDNRHGDRLARYGVSCMQYRCRPDCLWGTDLETVFFC